MQDLINILTQPKNAIVKQYKKLFEMDNVELNFDDDVLKLIAGKSLKRKSGARGLRTIAEQILLDAMYDVPNGNWKKITIKRKDNNFYIEKQNNSIQEIVKVGGFDDEKGKDNKNKEELSKEKSLNDKAS